MSIFWMRSLQFYIFLALALLAGCRTEKYAKLPVEFNIGFSNGRGVIVVDGRWGYIDHEGKEVIAPRFVAAGAFSEGLAPVRVSENRAHKSKKRRTRVGFIDTSGKMVIEPKHPFATPFAQGRSKYLVMGRGGSWNYGFMDRTGFGVIEPKYFRAGLFSDGLVAVQYGSRWGYVDLNGKKAIGYKYEKAQPFQEGLAAVMRRGKWGYIDKKGKWVVEPKFHIASPFKEGYAVVAQFGRFGFINRKGEFAIRPQYANAYSFSEGLAAVQYFNRKWGFVNKAGRFEILPSHDWVKSFSGGFAAVNKGTEWVPGPGGVMYVKAKGRWGYIDRSGKLVDGHKYINASSFSDEAARVQIGNDLAYVNTDFDVIWRQPKK